MVNKKLFELLLVRKNKILIDSEIRPFESEDAKKVLKISKNIESLGYTFSPKACEKLMTLSREEVYGFYQLLVETLKKITGADKVYKPFYVNFPLDMDEYEDWELYINALVHYISGGTLVPHQEVKERFPLFEDADLITLDTGTTEDLLEIRDNLLQSKTSLSQKDKEDLILLLDEFDAEEYPLPTIPFKETLCLVVKWFIQNKAEEKWYEVVNQLRTVTDVLRVAVALVDGDVSLSDKSFEFSKKFSRTVQRFLFTAMESAGNKEDDMKRHERLWKSFSTYTNISDYQHRFPKTYNTFLKLWNGKLQGYYGRLEELFQKGKEKGVISTLLERPGEFARHLDQALRTSKDKEAVLSAFKSVATDVSVPVLLQLKEYYEHRTDNAKWRTFFPKGVLQKAYTIENTLPELEEKYCKMAAHICTVALFENFKQREYLGRVYLSDSLKGYTVPQSQRSASNGKKIVTRCSRFPLKKDFVRFFIHWKNEMDDTHEYQTDIDLSCDFLTSEYRGISHISYTSLRNSFGCHSGDFTNAPRPNGACEFIDVNIEEARKLGVRYIVMQIYGFTNTRFSDMEYLDAGWMEREDLNSGEVFEPSLVENRINLTAKTRCAIPLIIDTQEKEVIWTDIAITSHAYFPANLESNRNTIVGLVRGIVEAHKPQMYDLVQIHTLARGHIATDRNNADIIFDVNTEKPVRERVIEERDSDGIVVKTDVITEPNDEVTIITPFDCDYWQSKML